MDSSCKKLPSTFDEQIAELEVKRKLKKKIHGWRKSKLDVVSDVLIGLRKKGKSLQFMADFVFSFHAIKVHKTTVKLYLGKHDIALKKEIIHENIS